MELMLDRVHLAYVLWKSFKKFNLDLQGSFFLFLLNKMENIFLIFMDLTVVHADDKIYISKYFDLR